MDYKDIDYSKYLSVDNGKGILLSKEDALVLKRYDIDYSKYSSLSSLIFEIEEILNNETDIEDLEEVSQRLSELNYYNNTNK